MPTLDSGFVMYSAGDHWGPTYFARNVSSRAFFITQGDGLLECCTQLVSWLPILCAIGAMYLRDTLMYKKEGRRTSKLNIL